MNIDWSKRTTQIARELKIHPKTVSKLRRLVAPETLQGKGGVRTGVAWAGVDWSKRTWELAAELGVAASTVSKWRMNLCPQSSMWGQCKGRVA